MKKICLAIVLFTIASCGASYVPDKLTDLIYQSVMAKDGKINISKSDSPNWNRLYIIPPYVKDSQLDSDLVQYKKEIINTGIMVSERNIVLVAMDNSRIVSLTVLPRYKVDFSEMAKLENGKVGYYKRSDTDFKYRLVETRYVVYK